MKNERLNDVAGALLMSRTSRKLLRGVHQERERIGARITALNATAVILRLEGDDLARGATRLASAITKLEALSRYRGGGATSTAS